jgi:hypothetical protein
MSLEERTKAADVAKRSGIPFPRAVLVIRGHETLDHVLKDLFTRQRRDRFVREGMDPSLAGQVATGRLELDRARRIQTIWQAQNASFHSDRLAALEGLQVGISVFGRGLIVGRLIHVGRYDVTIAGDGAGPTETLKKHDIKFYFRAEHADLVAAALGDDPETAALALGPSTVLAERWRPDENLAIGWATNHPLVRFRFRDGATLAGRPLRVALYEVEIACGEANVGVLTHALLKGHPFDLE